MALVTEPIRVEVVSAEGRTWEGDATQVIVRTTEGDLGILSNHVPLLAALVPHAAEITTTDGQREVIAVEGGFISVSDNRVSLISSSATLAREISLAEAERELAFANKALNEGDISDETRRKFNRATAQVKAAQKAASRH